MKLFVVTRPDFFEAEAELLTSMLNAGLQYVHIRKESNEIRKLHALLSDIPERYHSKIVYHGLATDLGPFKIGGIHLKETKRRINTNEFLIKYRQELNSQGMSLSSSFHDIDEMTRSIEQLDYAFIGPLFDSLSKSAYRENSQLHKAIPHCNKLIAIGGIEISKIAEVIKWNYSGIAVLGAIWMNSKPVKAFGDLQAACAKYKRINSAL